MSEPDPFNHEYATINGLRYHYVREGAGPPLFLIHGWPGFHYEWRMNIKPLAEHFEVIAPDMRGYGETDKPDLPPEEAYTPDVFAADIRGLIEHLGFDKVSIASHDFGSLWTYRFAVLHRDLIDKLVFFQPAYPGIANRFLTPDRQIETWYQFFHQLPLAEELVGSSREATEIYLRHFLTHWSGGESVWTDEEVERFVDAFSQPGALRGGFNCYRAMFRAGASMFSGDLTIHAPTLVLWGENDPLFKVEWADQLETFFKDLTFRSVPDCGHWLNRQKHELFNREVTEFLLTGGAAK
ncbi:MAG: alpha/beta hydrolase [Dehalococcoidia bacterium]